MQIRPTSFATWASGASGYVTEPITADKTQGFLPTGIARSSYVNWLHGLAGNWHQYLDEVGPQGLQSVAALTVGPTHSLGVTGAPPGSARINNFLTVGPSGVAAATGPTGCIMVSASLGGTNVSTAVARGTIAKESMLFAAASINGGKTMLACYNISGFTRTATGSMTLTFGQQASDFLRLCSAGMLTTAAGSISAQALGATSITLTTRDSSGNLIDSTSNWIFHNL